jgi:hypothetical protein
MNLTNIHEISDALRAGETVQFRADDGASTVIRWLDCSSRWSDWSFCYYQFRIKPKPRAPREWWGAVNDNDCLCCCYANKTTGKAAFDSVGGHKEFVHVREVLPEEET